MQWQLMPQCRDEWHMKHHNMNGNHSASDESTSLCVIAALSESLTQPVTSFDVAVSASQRLARLVRRNGINTSLSHRHYVWRPMYASHWTSLDTSFEMVFHSVSGRERKRIQFQICIATIAVPALVPYAKDRFPDTQVPSIMCGESCR